jgi:hypothetical protein
MMNPTPWAKLYANELRQAAEVHELDPLVLLAIAWQESHGGVVLEVGRWHWGPQRVYRYEPGFWDRYMGPSSRTWPKYRPPSEHPAVVEAWKRRVSASYGICQVMFTTAQERGFVGRPEALFDPMLSAYYGAKHLRHLLDGPAKGDLRDALAAYNTGRARDELTGYDDEVLARVTRLRSYADAHGDPFA